MKVSTIMTLDKNELETLVGNTIKIYEKQITDKINAEANRIMRDKAVRIFCASCNLNILFSSEPTVFGTKNGGDSKTYHMKCWRALEKEEK